jgi:hypothetical protein
MTAEPLSQRAARLGSVERALARPKPCYRAAFERTEEVTLAIAGSVDEQLRVTPDLLAELLATGHLGYLSASGARYGT